MKYSSTSAAVKRFGVAVGMATVLHSPAVQAGPSSWKNFTSGSTQPWSALANWTATTGVPATSDPTLVINFDPAQPGTTTSSGKINNSFTSTNDLGIVQINALNLGGAPNTVAEVIKIYGGALQFEGAGAVLSNSTTLNAIGSNVTYSVYNSIALDTDLSLAGNGTGPLNLAYSGGTISAMGGVLRTITITGSANWGLASSYTSAIIDGDGQVRIVMAGSGTLTLTSTNPAPFSGGMVIKSGAVTESGGSAGSMTFGQGPITLGDTNGSASAALQFIHTQTQTQPLTVAAGSTGTKSLQYTGTGSQTPTWIGPITLNGDLTLDVSGTSLGSTFIIGTSSSTNYLAGAGSLISSVNAGTGANQLNGNNTNWTGNVFVNAGKFQVNSATALSASNTVAVNSGASFSLYNPVAAASYAQTITGLNDGSGGGGTVINAGTVRTLTLSGSGNYAFSGVISTNLALTKSGSGTQILAGLNIYTGATIVSAGTLLVNGSLASTGCTVNAGATFGGTGVVAGVTLVKTNAILAPGGVGAVGALMVSNLVLQTGAVYNWDYGNGKGDLVTVTGSLTVPTVATVSVSCASGWLPRSCVILATTAAVGNVSGWVVTGNGTTGSRVVAVGTTVVLTSPAHGTAIMFR